MANERLAGIHALAARCRKVGWKVTSPPSVGGGYRIVCADGHVAILHSSYSDRNGIRAVTRELSAHGLLEAEEKQKNKREVERAKRIADDRKAADAKTAKLAQQAKLTAMAAGPYAGPEENVELSWFTTPHPAPTMRWVVITPAMAEHILKHNTDNRPLKARTKEHYRRIIQTKRFHLTHQGMAMDTRGILQDGQHRLHACVEADEPITVAFFVGMPVENFKAIDEGRNRTAADLLGKDGEVDVTHLSTTIRMVAASREPFPRAFLKMKTTNEQIYDSFKGDPDRLRAAVKWGRSRAPEARIVASALSAASYLLYEANGEGNEYVEAFLAGLVTGTKGESRVLLDADDPRLQFRSYLQGRRERGNRTPAHEQLGLILWAWNHVVNGRRLKHVKWIEFVGDIPPITVCRSAGKNASAPPELLHGEINARYS